MTLDRIIQIYPHEPKKIQQCKDEIQQVYDHLWNRKFNNFCEIGSNWGGSLWIYSHLFASPDCLITAMEINVTKLLKQTIDELRKLFNVRLNEEPKTIDLLHIDAGHEYHEVKADFEKYYPKVTTNGIILLHDTLLHDGTIKFRKELEHKYKTITFKGHDLLSKTFNHPDKTRTSTGITLIKKE